VPVIGEQLVSLTVTASYNAQVPYLLRSVLPNGLPSLRSLGIHQYSGKGSRDFFQEDARWEEDEHGNVGESSKRKMAQSFNAAYMISLARGAPNIEELELTGECPLPIEPIASALSTFSNLKRLYLSGPNGMGHQFLPTETQRGFLEYACRIALCCPSLESITEIGDATQANRCAYINYDTDGEVSVRGGFGFGRIVGLEDESSPGALI